MPILTVSIVNGGRVKLEVKSSDALIKPYRLIYVLVNMTNERLIFLYVGNEHLIQ